MIFLYAASDTFASRAKVLTDSITKFHPHDQIVHIKPADGPLGTYLPNLARTRLEKALELLTTTDEDVVIIGADCELFAEISHMYTTEAHFTDIVLVPHVKKPLTDREYMKQIYNSGHANADLMIFKNCTNSKNALKWLISVTQDGGFPGDFYEQTWLSALPFLFEEICIISNPGYNVGYWEINHVNIQKFNNQYFVDGHELVMFQYSGYVKGQPEKMSRYSSEVCTNLVALEIYQEYDRRITE